jgi:hypothetical protein
VTLAPASLRGGLGRSAHKFTRLNYFSGLSALLRNFSLPAAADPASANSESVLSDFNGLRRQFRVRFLFCLLLSRQSLDSLSFPENGEGRRNKLSGKQY